LLKTSIIRNNDWDTNQRLEINMSDGSITSPNFNIASNGDATFAGAITASSGSITGDLNVTSSLILGSSGNIYTSGKTTYGDTTAGIFLGYDAAVTAGYKMNIGDASNYLKWNGSSLDVKGDLGGTIGSITVGNVVWDSSGITATSDGTTPTFSLNPNSGEITATSGTIGG
jgi:hypothetical protein